MTLRTVGKTINLLLVAGLTATALGCVVGSGSNDDSTSSVGESGGPVACGDAGSHSNIGQAGECECDPGYTWAHPGDQQNFECVEIGDTGVQACDQPNSHVEDGMCYCDAGYEWCNPSEPDDFSCCEGPGTGTADTSGSDDGNDSGVQPDPAECDAPSEGAVFCSNTSEVGPQDSQFWICMAGSWVEQPAAADENCQADGYDFSFGCVDDGSAVDFLCGIGPGTACGAEVEATCVNADVLHACIWGRLTEERCATICSTIGDDDGVTYDSGFCDPDAVPVDCFCCDTGEPDCPA